MKSREIHLNAYLKGAPDPKYYDVVETDVPAPGAGEVLVRNLYISVDPYMRGRMSGVHTYIAPFGIDQVMDGGAVGEVIESNFDGLKPGDHVSSMFGWREGYVAPGEALTRIDTRQLPPQAFLGIAGMPGLTAYVGIKRMIDLQPGETLWMSGSSVAQTSPGWYSLVATG